MEPTKEMIAAGLKVYRDWEGSEDYRQDDMVRRVFEAMNEARPVTDLKEAIVVSVKEAARYRWLRANWPSVHGDNPNWDLDGRQLDAQIDMEIGRS
jgi:hypothetical protein